MHRLAAPICQRLAGPTVHRVAPGGGPRRDERTGPPARRAGSHASARIALKALAYELAKTKIVVNKFSWMPSGFWGLCGLQLYFY